MNIKVLFKSEWVVWLIIAAPIAILPFVWNQIPDQIPSHWNIRGEVDGYGGKASTLLLFPAISLGVYLLIMAAPLIDPKRRINSSQRALRAYRFVFPLLMNGIFMVVLLFALGFEFNVGKMIQLTMLLLFIGIGNYLSVIEPNYFIGLRTPWTLEDPDVWRKTHRATAKVWVVGGVILLLLWPFLDSKLFSYFFAAALGVMVLFPIILSYRLYKKSETTSGLIIGEAGENTESL